MIYGERPIVPYNWYFYKGRVALHAILKSMNIREGDEVILPGFTCVVVPNAIRYHGARPCFVDIDAGTFNIDPNKIEQKITKKTRVIIAQHTFGIPAEMDIIVEIAKKYHLFVVEDACHTISSLYMGKDVGTFGDAAFFSSQWSKPITTGLGGWALINNQDLIRNMINTYENYADLFKAEAVFLWMQYFFYSLFFKSSLFWILQRSYRVLSDLGLTIGSSSKAELKSTAMPVNYPKRMSKWQIKLIEKKLRDAKHDSKHRESIAALYSKSLKALGKMDFSPPLNAKPVFLRYPVLVQNKEKVLRDARARRIEIGDWFLSPLHPNRTGLENAGYEKGMCPVAESICERIINLPTHRHINQGEAERIFNFVRRYF